MEFDYKQLAKEISDYQQKEALRLQEEFHKNFSKSGEVPKLGFASFVKPSFCFIAFYSIATTVFCTLLLEAVLFLLYRQTFDFLTLFSSVYLVRVIFKHAFLYNAYNFINDFDRSYNHVMKTKK